MPTESQTTTKHIICWTNVTHPYEREYEEFDSLEDAQSALRDWVVKFPWNAYTMASVVGVSPATMSSDQAVGKNYGKVEWVGSVTAALPEVAKLLAPRVAKGVERQVNDVTLDPSDRRFTELLVDYLRRMPASVVNVASHFGMSEAHARDALWSLEQAGLAHKSGRSEWSAIDD